jgi:hypothetical protein
MFLLWCCFINVDSLAYTDGQILFSFITKGDALIEFKGCGKSTKNEKTFANSKRLFFRGFLFGIFHRHRLL